MGRSSKFGGTTGSTLTVSLNEKCSIDSRDYGGRTTITYTGILDVDRRIMHIDSSGESTILTAGAAPAAGVWAASGLRYIRIANLDTTNFIKIRVANEDDDEYMQVLEAGSVFIMTAKTEGMVDVLDMKDSAITPSLGDLQSIKAQADTADCDIEIYVAGT